MLCVLVLPRKWLLQAALSAKRRIVWSLILLLIHGARHLVSSRHLGLLLKENKTLLGCLTQMLLLTSVSSCPSSPQMSLSGRAQLSLYRSINDRKCSLVFLSARKPFLSLNKSQITDCRPFDLREPHGFQSKPSLGAPSKVQGHQLWPEKARTAVFQSWEFGKAVWQVPKGWLSSDQRSRKTQTSGPGEGKSEGRLQAWQWESGCKIRSAMGYFNVLADLVGGGHDGTRMRFTKKKKKHEKG